MTSSTNLTGKFVATTTHTPILNTPNFTTVYGGEDGRSLPLDDQKLLRTIEMIAFPKTKMVVLEQCNENIVRVKTNDYPYGEQLYVDNRFLIEVNNDFPERTKKIPSRKAILEELDSLEGIPYVWGGNWHLGVPEMFQFYPPKISVGELDPLIYTHWLSKGLDCTGLIYETSGGATPRNSSTWTSDTPIPGFYCKSVPIQGLSVQEIAENLKPLDAIVWRGHLILVYDEKYTIESRAGFGVVKYGIEERLSEIMNTLKRKPVNEWQSTASLGDRFVVKRWHPESIG